MGYTNVISFKTKKPMTQETLDRFVEAQADGLQIDEATGQIDTNNIQDSQTLNTYKIWCAQVLELIAVQTSPFRQDELYNVAMALFVGDEDRKKAYTQTFMSQVVGEMLQMAEYTKFVIHGKDEKGLDIYITNQGFSKMQIGKLIGTIK